MGKEASEKDELRKFFTTALELSTMMPFKWYLNRYQCFYCDLTFPDCAKLKSHTTSHQDVKLKAILRNIGAHSRIKLDISSIKCKRCDEEMRDIEDFIDHAARMHDFTLDKSVVSKYCYVFKLSDEVMSCVECGEKFKFFTPLLRHVNKYHNKAKQFICEMCGKGFALKGTIKSHIKNVHSLAPNECKLCHALFPTRHALINHNEITHQAGKFKCPICLEVLSSSYFKKSHLALVHNVQSCQFRCDLCPKVYAYKSKLLRHRSREHMKEKTATCHICGYKTFDIPTLKRHLLSHQESRPFRCEHCEKTFRWKKNLVAHKNKQH